MKMKIPVRRSCISLIVLSALVEAIRANENESSTRDGRQGRVSGRIIKVYSGYKPDPVLCTEEGFQADPVHCSVFYRCLKSSSGKFTVFKFQCGPGTVYDPETEVCNHPSNTKRSECGGIKSHVVQDNENDNDIDQHELPSPISTIVPVYTSDANHDIGYTTNKIPSFSSSDVYMPSAQNGYINSLTTFSTPQHIELTTKKDQDINHNLDNYSWTDYKNSTQQKITSSTTIFPIIKQNQPCTSDGFMGDIENCNKFYRCVSNSRGGFIRYEFLCSEPTVWDDHMQSCNHPWAVRSRRCGRVAINNENNMQHSDLSNNMSTEQTGVSYGVKLPENPYQESSEVSKQNEPLSNYGDRLNNLNEYNIEKNQISIGSPLDVYPARPNNDKNEETEANVNIDDINNFYGQKTTTEATYSTNKLVENSDSEHTEIGRNFICTQSGFVGDFVDCKKFYRCVENGKKSYTKYEFTCSQGTVWDKKLEACNYAWAVKDCGGTSAGASLITADSTTSSTSTTTPVLSENVDNGYINQSNQESETLSTITVSTPISLISTTAASNQIGTECTVTGFIADKNDCQKFYRCVDNGRGTFTKYEFKCGDGTLWDHNIEACNHAWAVHSCNSAPPSSTMHAMKQTTSETHTTALSIQSTTPENLQDNNDYNDVYGPQLDAASPYPETDLHKTTLAPIINHKSDCGSTEFIGDSNDCKKFYRCVNNGQKGFTKYEFSCGEGTVWDPEIEACNHAWAVKHCGTSISLNDEDVTSSSLDNTYLSTHDVGLTTAISSVHTSTPQKDISDYDSGYGQQQSVSTKRPNINLETTTLKQTQGHTNNCQTAGFIGDTNNCNKFYRCVDNGNGGFIQYEFSCGDDTVWDSEIGACNHAWAVKKCGGSLPLTENFLTSSTTNVNLVDPNNEHVTNNYIDNHSNSENFTTKQTTTSTSSTATLINITNTSNHCESSGFMGDNNDCTKFYRCVDNGNGGFVKHEFLCGEGTVWDTKIEACNHKSAVEKCGSNSYNEFVETTSRTLQPVNSVTESIASSPFAVTYSTTSLTTSITTSLNPLPSHEDRGCSSEGYFANPNDCKKFYRCVDEGKDEYTKYEFSCAEGTAWDVKIESCNYVSKVETCHSNQHIINSTETKPVHDEPMQITESDTTKTTTLTSPTSTSTTLSSTASTSTTLASTTSASKTSTSTTKNAKPAEQDTCKDEGYFGSINNCKKFYRCVYENNGVYTKYDFTCGDGTIWDQDITTCNHPRDVKNPSCMSKPESTSPISTSSTTDNNLPPTSTSSSTTTGTPTSTISESSSNNNDTNSNCSTTENSNNKNFTCTKAGFYEDKRNCKKFYRCVDWENNGKKFSIYYFECADGTIWDPALETCNHENSVYPPRNCNSTQQQIGNTTGTSSTTEPMTTTTNQTESTTTSYEPTTTSTQSTTTNEYSSTQSTQTSTAETPITQSSTTQSSTTEESTTQSSTTQLSTTEESTTQSSSTTEESTTQSSSTTEESTTQSSTTQSSTTEESTTQSSTTGESTTESSTTQSSTTEESTTQPSTTQSSTTEESTTQLSTTQSSTTEELTTQLSTTQSSSTDESTTTTQMTTSATDQSSTTTEQYTTTTESSSSSTTENSQESSTETSTNKECPDTTENQSLFICPTSFKRHPKYCNLFYQCTEENDSHELRIAVFNCPNNTIYDENKIQCVAENKSSKKCDGQISQKQKVKRQSATNDPFVVSNESMACKNSGHFPFEKHTECSSSLLKCELTKSGALRGFVYKCPDGFVYWNISRRCESIRKVRDCKRSSYPWKRRYDIPLERFNIAP